MSKTKLRIQGYTALFKLRLFEQDFRLLSLTGYNIEMERNILDSDGHWGQYDVIGFNTLNRFKTIYLQDCPAYKLTVDFEVTEPLLNEILTHITTSREKKVKSLFLDNANGISIDLAEMYLSDFSLNLDNNAVAVGSLTFLVRRSDFYYAFCEDLNLKAKSTTIPFDSKSKLMPYYWWGVETTVFSTPDLISFGLNWSQELIPKFTCCNSSDSLAPTFQHLFFAKPAMTFNASVFLGNDFIVNYDQYVGTQLNYDLEELQTEKIVVKYKNKVKMNMTAGVVTKFNPDFNLDGRYACTFDCDVYGILSLGKESLEEENNA